MFRSQLLLLLTLTLILNGISAPWAMAHTRHGDHAQSGMHAGHAPHTPAAPMQHDHADAGHVDHAGHPAQAVADSPAPAPHHDDDACCDGATCQCGCVLPPAVPFVGVVLAPQPRIEAAFVSVEQHAAPGRGSPPFRPPAA